MEPWRSNNITPVPEKFDFWDKDGRRRRRRILISRDAFGYARHMKIQTLTTGTCLFILQIHTT